MLRHPLLYRGVAPSIEQCVAFPPPMYVYCLDPLLSNIMNTVSSTTYVSAALVMIREFRRLQKVIPLDSSEIAPSNMHVIANHKAGEAPDPCSVPKTQL